MEAAISLSTLPIVWFQDDNWGTQIGSTYQNTE